MRSKMRSTPAGPILLILLILLLLLAMMMIFARVAASFEIQGLVQFGPAHVAVAFDDSVDAATALQPAHYTLTAQGGAPAIGIKTVALQDNQRTIVLTTSAPLTPAATYGVAVTSVLSRHGDPLQPGGPGSFTTVAETVTGIADVHAGINDLIGQTVTVIGQVFITSSSSGGTPSGYIQDGTGRGLNVFGTPLQPSTDALGNVVTATGTAALYFTTVELTPFTASVLASGMPPLGPRVLPVAQASSPQWEGTYIQTTATLTGPATPSGSNNYTYPAQEGGQVFTFRVRNTTGIIPSSFTAGDVVTGAGAGSNFQGTYQISVGNAADFYRGIGPGDITPPILIAAAGRGGESVMTVEFSEPMSSGAAVPTHYSVRPTASGSPLPITGAVVLGSTVTLTLGSALQGATSYTVEVTGVQDVAGNECPPASTVAFVAEASAIYGTSGAWQFGAHYVAVAFTRPVNATQALDPSHYLFAPALTFAAVTLQENGQTVVFRTADALPTDVAFTVTVTGVASADGEPLPAGPPIAFRTAAETVVDIATIQAEPALWSGRNVTVIGQVTIPVSSRGGTPSGYLQDGSGRGLNLFGGSVQGPVNELGSVARVTGLIELYFTTTEMTTYTATQVAADQPHLGARRMTVAEANDARWEGTYIETAGDVLGIAPSGTSAYNYTLGDGAAASIVARVATGLGIPTTDFSIGDRVTARGAGGSFQGAYQISVGNRADFFKPGAGGPDTTAPYPISAGGTVGSDRMTVLFSEALRPNEATNVLSYRVHRTGQPLDSIRVTAAALASGARSVYLTLATPLASGVAYTVQASGLADPTGNVMGAPVSVAVVVTVPAPPGAELNVPPVTLLRNLTRQGEVLRFEIAGPQDTRAACRIFDLQGRLVRVLFDGQLTGAPRRTLTWDARDESFELVPVGLYICHLQVTDDAGNVSRARAPIVVAVRLD